MLPTRRHALGPLLIFAVLLLIPLGVSARLACCAGMASMHSTEMDEAGCGEGRSCCDKARDDAIARHCCEGGERLDRRLTVPQVSAAPPVVLPTASTLGDRALVRLRWSTLLPPKTPDLFTLHSAFLI